MRLTLLDWLVDNGIVVNCRKAASQLGVVRLNGVKIEVVSNKVELKVGDYIEVGRKFVHTIMHSEIP
jgi:hypothetical protein